MSNYVNYLVEANLSLVIFLAVYVVVLRKETDFGVLRMFLLAGVMASLIFPLVHISFSPTNLPSLGNLIPTYLLPELVIGDQGSTPGTQSFPASINPRYLIELIYIAGVLFFFARFVQQLLHLIRKIKSASGYKTGGCTVVESNGDNHTFSFFRYIFLGHPENLTADEKVKIIQHETIHARRFHSFDLLLINVVGIFFWFNPVLKFYKKIFIQLHEFEADARAVDNRDTNVYCSLLAKVALESADFPLANHFNSSLIIKRIVMIRSIKQKMKTWKMIIATGVIPIVFFVVGCQDQVMKDYVDIAENSHDIPHFVQERFERLRNDNPGSQYILVEFYNESKQEETEQRLSSYEKKYGRPKSIELYTPDVSHNPLAGRSESGIVIDSKNSKTLMNTTRTFAIIEYSSDEIFDVVDEMAMPEGGLAQFYEYIANNIRYPLEARKKGIEGKVFVDFVVDINGTVDVTGVSGIGSECDLEVMRVVQASPKWIPGKNNGIAVKQKMTLPINFKIAGSDFRDASRTPEAKLTEIVVVGLKK